MKQQMDRTPALERFPPVMLHSILTAVRRFEPDLYVHICRRHHLDADRILGLFGELEMLGPGQLTQVLADLRAHTSYDQIMRLAGRNTLVEYAALHNLTLNTASENKLRTAIGELLPVFSGKAAITLISRGNVLFLEMFDSVFARGISDARTLCGFYCGLLAELGASGSGMPREVTESRCRASNHDTDSCQFQIGLG